MSVATRETAYLKEVWHISVTVRRDLPGDLGKGSRKHEFALLGYCQKAFQFY